MKVLNFGSLNIDMVYAVDHFVRAGETLSSDRLVRFCGGLGGRERYHHRHVRDHLCPRRTHLPPGYGGDALSFPQRSGRQPE